MPDPNPEIRSPKETRNPKARRASNPPGSFFGFRASDLFRISDFGFRIFSAACALVFLTACGDSRQKPKTTPASAQALFGQASTNFHLPSAEAKGPEKVRLLEQAAAAYEALLRHYPDDAYWAAQALRNLGNVRAAQGRTNDAVQLYASLERRYPQQRWEVLAALKSAGDLLWDAGRREEARGFYRKIVAQFDAPDASQVIQTVVRGSKAKLNSRE